MVHWQKNKSNFELGLTEVILTFVSQKPTSINNQFHVYFIYTSRGLTKQEEKMQTSWKKHAFHNMRNVQEQCCIVLKAEGKS